MSFLQHVLGTSSCHFHNSGRSGLHDLVSQMSPPRIGPGREKHRPRENTQLTRGRPSLFFPKGLLDPGPASWVWRGCCSSPLWSTGTRAKRILVIRALCAGCPSPCCGSGCRVRALRTAYGSLFPHPRHAPSLARESKGETSPGWKEAGETSLDS